jgi:hypothetical protein
MTLVNRLEAEGVFDRDAVRILGQAFDEAWNTLVESGAQFADAAEQNAARDTIAKHIIQMARLGERDPKRLAESALLEFGRADLKPCADPKP